MPNRDCGYEELPESHKDPPSDEVCEGPDGVEADVLLRVVKGFPEQNQEILKKYAKNYKSKYLHTSCGCRSRTYCYCVHELSPTTAEKRRLVFCFVHK